MLLHYDVLGDTSACRSCSGVRAAHHPEYLGGLAGLS